jgi:ribose transport system ATP-binding protein
MSKLVLSVKGITKDFPGVRALKGVDFDLNEGEIHALCGENGAGKSTLMHILAGVFKQDVGEILLNGEKVSIANQKNANELGISIVYQERSLVGSLNVAENIFAARQPVGAFSVIKWKKLYDDTTELLLKLGIHIDPKAIVDQFSPAMQQMIEIAKALSLNPQVLILDEPTATITEKEVGLLFSLLRKLKEQGTAIIYISHRLAEIFQIADRVTVFKDGEHIATEEVINIDNEWIVNKMVGRELYFNRVEKLSHDEIILECIGLNSSKFKDINFKVGKGEIVSFAGLAGAGRTEVMRGLFGADKVSSGEVFINGKKVRIRHVNDAIKNGIGYLPEDRKDHGLFLEMAVSTNIASASLKKLSKGMNIDNKLINKTSETYRKKLNIITPSIHQKVVNLSGGNQQKVVLAKWLVVNPKIMIVDEPTRGVDIGAKAEIYQILRELTKEGTSIIVVSSDLPEVLAISDRIYIMHNGEIKGELSGDEATEQLVMKYASGIMN